MKNWIIAVVFILLLLIIALQHKIILTKKELEFENVDMVMSAWKNNIEFDYLNRNKTLQNQIDYLSAEISDLDPSNSFSSSHKTLCEAVSKCF